MIKAACHCGAARFEIADAPEWVLDCNCTICRRYGALWTYYHGADHAKLLRIPAAAATTAYLWGSRSLEFHRCKACGCVTHLQTTGVDPPVVFAVNARMIPSLDPARVRLRQVDNGHTGWFWTRSAEPVITSRHPVMPPPGPDDWR